MQHRVSSPTMYANTITADSLERRPELKSPEGQVDSLAPMRKAVGTRKGVGDDNGRLGNQARANVHTAQAAAPALSRCHRPAPLLSAPAISICKVSAGLSDGPSGDAMRIFHSNQAAGPRRMSLCPPPLRWGSPSMWSSWEPVVEWERCKHRAASESIWRSEWMRRMFSRRGKMRWPCAVSVGCAWWLL